MEEDAKAEMKRFTEDYTPEEELKQLKQKFYIREIPYISTEEYNREYPPMKYCEEDYDGDEENENEDDEEYDEEDEEQEDEVKIKNVVVENRKQSDESFKKLISEYKKLELLYVGIFSSILIMIHLYYL